MIQAGTSSNSSPAERPRAERRIAVRLPLTVRGRDSRGVTFVEETSSENLCRGGAAFLTRFDVAVGSDLEIYIPFSQSGTRRKEPDFVTKGKVVHVRDVQAGGEYFVGVQFTGPRFRRFFHPESAA
jgi:PilZ domain